MSTLSINSHGFALSFLKSLIPMERVLFVYKPMIIPLINRCGTFIINTINIQIIIKKKKKKPRVEMNKPFGSMIAETVPYPN